MWLAEGGQGYSHRLLRRFQAAGVQRGWHWGGNWLHPQILIKNTYLHMRYCKIFRTKWLSSCGAASCNTTWTTRPLCSVSNTSVRISRHDGSRSTRITWVLLSCNLLANQEILAWKHQPRICHIRKVINYAHLGKLAVSHYSTFSSTSASSGSKRRNNGGTRSWMTERLRAVVGVEAPLQTKKSIHLKTIRNVTEDSQVSRCYNHFFGDWSAYYFRVVSYGIYAILTNVIDS